MPQPESVTSRPTGLAMFDQAVLEVLALRETLFGIGDGALIELADTLLLGLGQAAGRFRFEDAPRSGVLQAA